jgi:lipopolysaccharide transport system ATP-binding protein
VRLAFAVAAHLEPEILVIDEVLAVGDAQFQKRCLGKMQDVAYKEGRTILFVSHNMTAVRNLCGRSILMSGGRIAANGPTETTIAIYSQYWTGDAGLTWSRPGTMGIAQMGFERIDAQVEGKQPALRLLCDINLRCVINAPAVMVAVDIRDPACAPLMQAMPSSVPFIPGAVGVRQVSLEIDLPPLVPGCYSADFWIGTHFLSTMDHVTGAITFEIGESPCENRNSPHTPEHGYIVPESRCRVAVGSRVC